MKCPYDESVECYKIGYENWATGKLPCDKCEIGICHRLQKWMSEENVENNRTENKKLKEIKFVDKCPECNGEGKVWHFDTPYKPGTLPRYRIIPCPCCGGNEK